MLLFNATAACDFRSVSFGSDKVMIPAMSSLSAVVVSTGCFRERCKHHATKLSKESFLCLNSCWLTFWSNFIYLTYSLNTDNVVYQNKLLFWMLLWYLPQTSSGRALQISNGESVLSVLHLAFFFFTWAPSLVHNLNNKSQRSWFRIILSVAVFKIPLFF